jgi:osmotically inducible protein OsmC
MTMAATFGASAIWHGSRKEGHGHVSTNHGALEDVPYDFRARFEGAPGTTPEELIGAAHAACFSMAFSAELGKAGMTPAEIATTATVTMEFPGGVPTVTKSHLSVTASVPGAAADAVMKAANDAKAGCPISRLLAAAEITMEARLA